MEHSEGSKMKITYLDKYDNVKQCETYDEPAIGLWQELKKGTIYTKSTHNNIEALVKFYHNPANAGKSPFED